MIDTKHRSRTVRLLLLSLAALLATPRPAFPQTTKKSTARTQFAKAESDRRSLEGLPQSDRTVKEYERVIAGFKEVYDAPEARLLSLFSAGGLHNADLPPTSNYLEVTPMALTITHKDGVTQLAPFAIDYERYNNPEYNSFFRESLGEAAP